ncbi:regulator of ime2 [Pyricularia grisea]|nr:regulator of ime2 [Pyricularia grisea]
MLRPATPLAVLLAGAFGLLLISVLSTPIIKAIPLGEYVGVTFGVFGYCINNNARCSPIEIGYDEGLAAALAEKNANFDLPSQARRTLSTILIIHPVAALVTLIMFIMSIVAHFHSPSHSARYLLIVFIVGLLNFFICLLAFLVDVLLFVPHMAWGSYLVLAATILVALSGLVACAMRRTLVSRKARKKRIEENAEMSGENFYNRQAQQVTPPAEDKPTVPNLSGANGEGGDKLPSFATYEKRDDLGSEDRVPLTANSPANRSPNAQYNDPNRPDGQFNQPRRTPSGRDQYGNPIEGPMDAYGVQRAPSAERMNPGARGGYRGRGYGPPGRGGGYGYGPPPGSRGGYGPPGRGGYGPGPNGRGGYGPPPRGGYGPPIRGRPPPPGYQYDRRGSPAEAYGPPPGQGPYGQRQQSPGPPSAPGYGMNGSTPTVSSAVYGHQHTPSDDLPRAESPPPLPGTEPMQLVGQAVAMDASTGSPPMPQNGFAPMPPNRFGGGQQFRDSDADIQGMVGLQQGISPAGQQTPPQQNQTLTSEPNRYHQEGAQYVPARQNWNDQRSKTPGAESVIHPSMMPQPLNASRTDLSMARNSPGPVGAPARSRTSEYYEDIAPRFATPDPSLRGTPVPGQAGGGIPPPINLPAGAPDFDEMPDGSRSPAASERSTFTSISQRGINPRWNPPPPSMMPGYGPAPQRRPNRNDMLLNSNPDFELPTNRGGRGGSPPRAPGTSMIPGSAYPNGRL